MYSIQSDVEKIRFEHVLEKKVESVEYLGKMQLQKERDLLVQYKQQTKIFKKIGISSEGEGDKKDKNYELQSLLNESSSDDENKADDEEEDSEDEETGDTDFDDSALHVGIDIESGGRDSIQSSDQLLMQEELKESE